MKEKSPKNPILVVLTIIFLSLFIILPPVFRAYLPKEPGYVEPEIVKRTLYCEKISVVESKKITMKISYEDGVAVKNVLTFLNYTPTTDEIVNDAGIVPEKTVVQEINYLKAIAGVNVNENSSQTVIEITRQNVVDNPTMPELGSYLEGMTEATERFESLGFTCSEVDN